MHWEGVVKHYWDYLPLENEKNIVTLLEGNTPLIPAKRLAEKLDLNIMLYLKFEGVNPTGSFKDRGMTMAISKAREDGAKAVICASTGNTSAAAAAYAAKCGMKAYVLIPEGKIALGKLSQAMMHGAEVIQVKGNFDEALKLVVEISDTYPITLVNSINPYRIEGQKTASFEICDVLGRPPDIHALPVGNAGNITAYWKGYREYHDNQKISALPKMWGFQAAGAAPIVRGYPIEKPETIATAIRIGNPASWKKAEAARDESGGCIDMVTDEEILAAYTLLSEKEGIFCEPASASGIAGLARYGKEKGLGNGEIVVATLTGHGLKDPDNAIKQSRPTTTLPPDKNAIIRHIGL